MLKLLASVDYDPGTAETKTVTGTTPADFDATNLAVTFTSETSQVLVVLEGYAWSGGTGGDQVVSSWNVREGSSDVFPHHRVARDISAQRHRLSRVVSATPDVATTWKWGGRSSSATLGTNLQMGGSGVPGPATMEVWEIGAGELLDLVQYNPDPADTPTTSSTTYVDVDATNLAVGFTMPASGLVLVELEAACEERQAWTIREGTTNLDTLGIQCQQGAFIRIHQRFFIAAAAGAKTWKWGWHRIDPDAAALFYGTDYGLAEMRVWEVT